MKETFKGSLQRPSNITNDMVIVIKPLTIHEKID